jgi:hypothetical protein
MQLKLNQEGFAGVWILMIVGMAAAVLMVASVGQEFQITAERMTLSSRIALDSEILQQDMVRVLGDPQFCLTAFQGTAFNANGMIIPTINVGTGASITPLLAPGTNFNSLAISQIQIQGVTVGATTGWWTGKLHFTVQQSSSSLGVMTGVDLDITLAAVAGGNITACSVAL